MNCNNRPEVCSPNAEGGGEQPIHPHAVLVYIQEERDAALFERDELAADLEALRESISRERDRAEIRAKELVAAHKRITQLERELDRSDTCSSMNRCG
jgi:hypothetical protein